MIIYATKPLAAVIGTARIDQVCEGSPVALWDKYQDEMAIAKQEFDRYVTDAPVAYLLLLSSAQRLASPLSLDDMREVSGFRPPRSYRYLDHATLRTLVNGHPGGSSLLSLITDGLRQPGR